MYRRARARSRETATVADSAAACDEPTVGWPSLSPRLSAPAWSALAYSALVVVAFAIALVLGRSPLARDPWLPTSGVEAAFASLVLGLSIAALTLLATRALGARTKWARALEAELHPIVRGQTDGALSVMALASGIGEEIFFRGLLSPWIGVILSSLAFGAVHQVRGPGRIGWMASAAALGLAFALVFGATGSLLGPVVGHTLINFWNLRGLRSRSSPAIPPPARLGGILRRR